MAEVASAQLLLLENSRETSTEKRQKREELERDARGLEKQSGEGWLKRRSGLLALWSLGCGTGSCLLFTDTEPLVELSRVARRISCCSNP